MYVEGDMTMTEPKLIISVPGLWKDRTELVQIVARTSGGYLLAGNILHNAKENVGFEIDVYEHDPGLAESYAMTGNERFNDELLSDIHSHTYTVYIIADGQGFEAAKNMMNAANGLLKSGGLAVKVETAGTAYTKEEWTEIMKEEEYFSVYSSLVTLINDDPNYTSVGMQSFGLPDSMVSTQFAPDEAADIMNNFNWYLLTSSPELNDGETIQFTEEGSTFKLTHWEDTRYEYEDAFFNPLGLWEISKL